LVLFRSRGAVVRAAALAALLLAGAIWMLLVPVDRSMVGALRWLASSSFGCVIVKVLAAAGTFIFSLVLFAHLRSLVLRSPVFTVDEAGIDDRTSLLPAGRLRWDEIDSFTTYALWGRRFLGITPRDLDDILRRAGGIKRLLLRLGRRINPTPLCVPEVSLPISLDNLIAEIAARRPPRVD
jgi:hypothetical protein